MFFYRRQQDLIVDVVASMRRSLSVRKSLDLETRARLAFIAASIPAGKEIFGLLAATSALASIAAQLGSKSPVGTVGGRKIPTFSSDLS